MQPLREAIKKKYGVSDQESDQVIKALAEIERVRQDAAGPQVQGFRARQPGDKTNAKEVPDIGTIIGQTTNTRSRQTGSAGGVAGMGFVSIIISIFMTILKVFLGSRQAQGTQGTQGGSGAVTSILTDLLGGATNPTQAPDLGSIIGGLLQNSGGTSGGQTPDIQDMVQVLLNQPSSPTGNPGLTRPKAR